MASYEHRITTLVGDVAVLVLVDTSRCFTSGHMSETAITSSFGLSVYTKGIQSDVAIENALNAHFICFMTGTQTTKDQIYHFIRLNHVFLLTYAANL